MLTENLCCEKEGEQWKPLLLVIPLRLGLSEINEIYTDAVLNSFKMKHSLGIIGGRPSHALYFIGIQREELVFLDPHTTHNFVDLEAEPENDESYHCKRAQRMNITSMDPSIAMVGSRMTHNRQTAVFSSFNPLSNRVSIHRY